MALVGIFRHLFAVDFARRVTPYINGRFFNTLLRYKGQPKYEASWLRLSRDSIALLKVSKCSTDRTDDANFILEKIMVDKRDSNLSILKVNSPKVERENARATIQCLLDFQYNESQITNLFENSTNILVITVDKFQSSLKYLTDYGFEKTDILEILTSYPEILEFKQQAVTGQLEFLREFGFSDVRLLRFVSSCPAVLGLPPQMISNCLFNLKELFSDKDALRLVEKSPVMLFDPWETTQYKFHYVHFAMGVNQRDMMKTELFSHSATHIRARHEFLRRAGLYVKPDNKGRCIIKNPSLKLVLDTTDKYFATRVANMDVGDYVVFCKILDLEDLPELDNKMNEY